MYQQATLASFFRDMGPVLWLLLPILIIIIYLVIKGVLDILKNPEMSEKMYREMHSILFWGSLAAMLGFMSQILGLWQAIAAIIAATNISPAIVMMGFQVSFYGTIFGGIIFIFSLISWFVLTRIINRRIVD